MILVKFRYKRMKATKQLLYSKYIVWYTGGSVKVSCTTISI